MSASSLPPLILASASPRRSQLLQELGVEFEVLPGHAEEISPEHLTPAETAMINAYRKARVIAKREPDHLVLAADTVVAVGTRLFGKPATRAEAALMLTELQGREHEVVTGICLIHQRVHRQQTFAEGTRVLVRPLEPTDIAEYLAGIDPLDKAGGYAIQEQGSKIIESIQGSFSNVVGLPVERLKAELERWPCG